MNGASPAVLGCGRIAAPAIAIPIPIIVIRIVGTIPGPSVSVIFFGSSGVHPGGLSFSCPVCGSSTHHRPVVLSCRTCFLGLSGFPVRPRSLPFPPFPPASIVVSSSSSPPSSDSSHAPPSRQLEASATAPGAVAGSDSPDCSLPVNSQTGPPMWSGRSSTRLGGVLRPGAIGAGDSCSPIGSTNPSGLFPTYA